MARRRRQAWQLSQGLSPAFSTVLGIRLGLTFAAAGRAEAYIMCKKRGPAVAGVTPATNRP